MALLHCTWLHNTLPWLYFTIVNSKLHHIGSTTLHWSLHNFTMALLASTWLYITLHWLSTSLYFTPHNCSMVLLHCTWFYITLHWLHALHFIWLYLLYTGSTSLYLTLHLLYFTLLNITLVYHGSMSLCLTLHYSTMAIFHSTWLYITLYYGSTSFHLTPTFSAMHGSTSP